MITHVEDPRDEGLGDHTSPGVVHDGGGECLDAELRVERLGEGVQSHHAGQVLGRNKKK